MTDPLRSCPFCGGVCELIKIPIRGKNVDRYDIRHIGIIGRAYDKKCILDGFDGLYLYETEEEAINAWNTRADLVKDIADQVMELREEDRRKNEEAM